jgi:hypothetical protein
MIMAVKQKLMHFSELFYVVTQIWPELNRLQEKLVQASIQCNLDWLLNPLAELHQQLVE